MCDKSANLSKFGKILKSGFGKKMKRKNKCFLRKKFRRKEPASNWKKNVRKPKKRAKKHSHMSSSFVHNEDASKTSANSLVSSLWREMPSRVILTTPRGLPLRPLGPPRCPWGRLCPLRIEYLQHMTLYLISSINTNFQLDILKNMDFKA